MPPSPASSREDRVFVRDGRRHHRPRYSWTEFRLGLLALLVLAGIVGWVAWRGAHPDPSLFAASPSLSTASPPSVAPSLDRFPSTTSGGKPGGGRG